MPTPNYTPVTDTEQTAARLADAFPGDVFDVHTRADTTPLPVLVEWRDGPTRDQVRATGIIDDPCEYRRTLSAAALATVAVGHWLRGDVTVPTMVKIHDINVKHWHPDISRLGRMVQPVTRNEYLRDGRAVAGSLPARSQLLDLIDELADLGPLLVEVAELSMADLVAKA
jgi:hypothetical protein